MLLLLEASASRQSRPTVHRAQAGTAKTWLAGSSRGRVGRGVSGCDQSGAGLSSEATDPTQGDAARRTSQAELTTRGSFQLPSLRDRLRADTKRKAAFQEPRLGRAQGDDRSRPDAPGEATRCPGRSPPGSSRAFSGGDLIPEENTSALGRPYFTSLSLALAGFREERQQKKKKKKKKKQKNTTKTPNQTFFKPQIKTKPPHSHHSKEQLQRQIH